jgi:hypothetical protein
MKAVSIHAFDGPEVVIYLMGMATTCVRLETET